jgi:hypothetical protein
MASCFGLPYGDEDDQKGTKKDGLDQPIFEERKKTTLYFSSLKPII